MNQTSKNLWHPLEHELYRKLNEAGVANRKLVLMVSGGADSVALFHFIFNLKDALGLQLTVLHCHHGFNSSSQQNQYRDQAKAFVEKLAHDRQVDFKIVTYAGKKEDEASFREFRKTSAESIRQKLNAEFTVWAHHQDDFLETQIMRLLRGTGPEALFEPMSFQRQAELRPLLDVSRDQIQAYLRDKNLEWCEDPSNLNQDYLRNWIRQNWLPALEEKCPGAKASFTRSLGLLQESHFETVPPEIWTAEGLSRPVYLGLNDSQKKQVLAQYLRKCGKLDFSHNQIKEVVKHLDIPRLNHTFKSAQVTWAITRDLIKVAGPVVHTI